MNSSSPSFESTRAKIGWIPESLNPNDLESVCDVLQYSCEHYGSKPAFTCMGQTITYDQLNEMSAAFAAYLQTETSLERGDRIAIQLPNILQYPVVLFGAFRAGMVVVNTNPLYTPTEMEHQFRDSGAKALVIYQPMAFKVEEILASTKIETILLTQLGDMHSCIKRNLINFVVKHVKKMEPDFNLPNTESLREILAKYSGTPPKEVPVNSDSIAVLQYTGGTTGVAKGAELTHANLVSNLLQSIPRVDQAGEGWSDNVISPLPLYHIYAFNIAQGVMYIGGHSILIPNPRDIPGFVKELGKWPFSSFLGLNTLFIALSRDPKFSSLNFDKLKMTASGGMALTHAAAATWEKITGCTITEGYGLTETSPIVTLNIPGEEIIGTIGPALPETKLRIIDDKGENVVIGEPGELCVWGPQVMVGYWHRPNDTKDCFTNDGYFRTGDIAIELPDSYFKLVDRAKDLIIVSGFNVYPNEVEDVVCEHPDIVECAVVGCPDEVAGESVKLFAVKSNPDLSEKDIRKFCRTKLTAYKVPSEVVFVADLPKSNVGKVLRRELRDAK